MSPNRPAVLYEKVTVSEGGSPLLRDMLFSPDQQYIYTLTDRQVSSVLEMHTQKCAQIKTHKNSTAHTQNTSLCAAVMWEPNDNITNHMESNL